MFLGGGKKKTLTKSLHGFDQLELKGLVFGEVLEHAGHFVVPRPHDVLPVNALDVVSHTDHLHAIGDAALLYTLHTRTGKCWVLHTVKIRPFKRSPAA